jgi:hypothetical protein
MNNVPIKIPLPILKSLTGLSYPLLKYTDTIQITAYDKNAEITICSE